MAFASDNFAGSAGQDLATYNAAWSLQTGHTATAIIGNGGQYFNVSNASEGAWYQHSGSPASADYSVFADIKVLAVSTPLNWMGILGRCAAAADTFYWTYYRHDTGKIYLVNRTAGSNTSLGTDYTITLTTGQTYNLELRMSGSSISVYLDSSLIIGPVTDGSPISGAGKAGIFGYNMREAGVQDVGSVDNWSAVDAGGDISTAISGSAVTPNAGTTPPGISVGI